MMRAGKLNQRVVIEQYIATQNYIGQPIFAWIPVRMAWASIAPIRGSEYVRSGLMIDAMDTRISVRYSSELSSIDSSWRVVFGEKIYNIVSVADALTMHVYIELMCKSGIPTDAASNWILSDDGEFIVDVSGNYLTA